MARSAPVPWQSRAGTACPGCGLFGPADALIRDTSYASRIICVNDRYAGANLTLMNSTGTISFYFLSVILNWRSSVQNYQRGEGVVKFQNMYFFYFLGKAVRRLITDYYTDTIGHKTPNCNAVD